MDKPRQAWHRAVFSLAQPQHWHPQSEATVTPPHHRDQWHPHPGVRGKKEPPSSLEQSVQIPTAGSVRPQMSKP